MYSRVTMILYSDSTYSYKEWCHTGLNIADYGKFKLRDTLLTLYSINSEETKIGSSKVSNNKIFTGQGYRVYEKSLLLYTLKQEEENADYYKLYFTLRRAN